MISELTKLANTLDKRGLMKEADYLDALIEKCSGELVSAEKAMEHETHTLSLEQPGAADAEAQEDYERDLAESERPVRERMYRFGPGAQSQFANLIHDEDRIKTAFDLVLRGEVDVGGLAEELVDSLDYAGGVASKEEGVRELESEILRDAQQDYKSGEYDDNFAGKDYVLTTFNKITGEHKSDDLLFKALFNLLLLWTNRRNWLAELGI